MSGIGNDTKIGALAIVSIAGIMFFLTASPSWVTMPMKAIFSLVFILIFFAALKSAF
jgi:hypothetical protein